MKREKYTTINIISKDNKFFIYDNKYNFMGIFEYLTQYLEINDKQTIKLNSLQGASASNNKTFLIFNAVILTK